MGGYHTFATVYDVLTDDVDYAKRATYFSMLLKKHTKHKGILLDLACGTGSLTEEFAKLGFDVIGVDNSEDMLSEAMNKKVKSGFDIIYLLQDMRELDLFGTIDVAVCALDGLNHLIKTGDLLQALKRISLFLHPDGYFIFDMNTVYKHKKILADNIFIYDYDDVYLVWKNTLLKQNTVQIDLDIFLCENGSYSRSCEKFYERAYTQAELEALLSEAGLRIVSVFHEDSLEEPRDDSQRLVYVTKKG